MNNEKQPRIILYAYTWGKDPVAIKRAINEAAAKAGKSVSSWGLDHLYRQAKRELKE